MIACPGFNVAGNVAPDTAKPTPLSVAPLIVTGAKPVEVRVSDCPAAVVFTCTLPNERLVALTLSAGTAAFNCSAKLCEVLPPLAVSVAVSAAATDETVAVKSALVSPAGTVTVTGKTIAALLLARLTVKPPLGAAALRVMVQASVPNPVIVSVAHDRAVTDGVGVVAVEAVPVSWTTVVGCSAASLLTVTCPEVVPAAEGLKRTCRL